MKPESNTVKRKRIPVWIDWKKNVSTAAFDYIRLVRCSLLIRTRLDWTRNKKKWTVEGQLEKKVSWGRWIVVDHSMWNKWWNVTITTMIMAWWCKTWLWCVCFEVGRVRCSVIEMGVVLVEMDSHCASDTNGLAVFHQVPSPAEDNQMKWKVKMFSIGHCAYWLHTHFTDSFFCVRCMGHTGTSKAN